MNRPENLNSEIRTDKDLNVKTRLMTIRAVLELGHSAESMPDAFDIPSGV